MTWSEEPSEGKVGHPGLLGDRKEPVTLRLPRNSGGPGAGGTADLEGKEEAQEEKEQPAEHQEKIHKGGQVTLDYWEDELKGSAAEPPGSCFGGVG